MLPSSLWADASNVARVDALLLSTCGASPLSMRLSPATPSASVTVRTDAGGNVLSPTTDPAIWTALAARPVQLPSVAPRSACPTSSFATLPGSATGPGAGAGPIYPVVGATAIGLGPPDTEGLRGGKVLWAARPDYTGVALIRGRRLDGAGDVQFLPRLSALRFEENTRVTAGTATDGSAIRWRHLPSTVFVPAPGCYGFQIDAPTWTATVVLTAVEAAR